MFSTPVSHSLHPTLMPPRSPDADRFWNRLRTDDRRLERAAERVRRNAGLEPGERFPEAPSSPCFGQAEEEIGQWLRANVAVGVEVVVRHTQGRVLDYKRGRVTGLGRGRFRVAHVRRDGSLGNEASFYYSGKHCFHPKGQTRLVIPTPAVLRAVEELELNPGALPSWRTLFRVSVY